MPVKYPHDYETGALNPWSDVLGISGRQANSVLGQQMGYTFAPILQGVVLYAWKEMVRPDTFSESDPLNFRELEQETVFVKVRIPEIHSLPRPFGLPSNNDLSDPGADWDAINRYPSFQAVDASVIEMPLPQPGEIVKVDFRDRFAQIGPIYMGPVKESTSATPTPVVPSSTQSVFDKTPTMPTRLADLPKSPQSWVEEFESVSSDIRLLSPNPRYTENRVRAGSFSSLPKSSPLLVEIPGGAMVHRLFADRLKAMNDAWRAKTGLQPFKSSNGWRSAPEVRYAWLKNPNHWRFKNFSKANNNAFHLRRALATGERNHYKLWEAMLLDEYNGDLRLGKVRRAWNSPHQAGLAIDFNNNGLSPMTKKVPISKQKNSKAYKWLVDNAHIYGINPYKKEPWHWECVIPRDNFVSGTEFSPDNYNVRVEETSKMSRKTTAHHLYAKKRFT